MVMKIERFNENVDDDFVYKGELTYEFEINRKTLIKNARMLYSDKYMSEHGIEGVLYEYVKHLMSKDDSKYLKDIKDNVKFEYEIYDKNGTVVDKTIFDNKEKFNL